MYVCMYVCNHDSVAATVQGAELLHANRQAQTIIHRIASDVGHPVTNLAGTHPWICPNTAGLAAEAPKPDQTSLMTLLTGIAPVLD